MIAVYLPSSVFSSVKWENLPLRVLIRDYMQNIEQKLSHKKHGMRVLTRGVGGGRGSSNHQVPSVLHALSIMSSSLY